MTQHNAALVEETNAAIEQTEAQATELDHVVEIFTVPNAPRKEPGGTHERVKSAAKTYLATDGNAAIAKEWSEF